MGECCSSTTYPPGPHRSARWAPMTTSRNAGAAWRCHHRCHSETGSCQVSQSSRLSCAQWWATMGPALAMTGAEQVGQVPRPPG